jgi:hypothetical protein
MQEIQISPELDIRSDPPADDAQDPATTSAGAPTGAEQASEPSMAEREPLVPAGTIHTPLQGFVSHQVHEVGTLSSQIDLFKAAGRPEVVQALYHMIRDHVLVSEAARNVLARRGDVSRPVSLFSQHPMPTAPEEVIRHDIEAHERSLESTRQLFENAQSPEERNIYQQAMNAAEKHLQWLRSFEQGEPVRLGFFGPTIPLARIAGYRDETGTRPTNGRNVRNRR